MKQLKFFLAIIAVCVGCTGAFGAVDTKFYKKAASKVFEMEQPEFDAKANLSDDIFKGQAAVYIARLQWLVADYVDDVNPSKQDLDEVPLDYIKRPTKVYGYTEFRRSNATKATRIVRNMVKINSEAALSDFTTFYVDAPEVGAVKGYEYKSVQPAFGARVFKADGNVVDVDIAANSSMQPDGRYKVTIPGLAAGDVLDYFYYTEYWYDEVSLPEDRISLLAKYPTRHFTLDYHAANRLAIEYDSYNGAPKISLTKAGDKNHAFLAMENLGALDESMPFFSSARQTPTIEIGVLNNLAQYVFIPDYAVVGGVRNVTHEQLRKDVASVIYKTEYPGRVINQATGAAKAWRKAHPQASKDDICDAAWLAVNYYAAKAGEPLNPTQIAGVYFSVVDKLGINVEARIGVATGRDRVPIDTLRSYNDASYMVKAGDRFYFTEKLLAPGAVPAGFDREPYVVFNGSPQNRNLERWADSGVLPATKATDNETKVVSDISIVNGKADVASELTLCGSAKNSVAGLVADEQCLAEMAAYLGIDKAEQPVSSVDGKAQYAGVIWGNDNVELSEFSVKSTGVTPESPATVLEVKGTVGGIVNSSANAMTINIGSLIGEQPEIAPGHRSRDISIVTDGPRKADYTITLTIPEGYKVDAESLAALNSNIATAEASFYSGAEVNGNTVTVRVVERFPRSIYPATSWPNILSVLTAANAFTQATLTLTR